MEQFKPTDSSRVFKDRSPDTVTLDNLIRRKLRVSDPNNPEEIARALQNYYVADKEAMNREAAGLPFGTLPSFQTFAEATQKQMTSTNAELEQAVTDVERDLKSLIGNALLKDIEPELNGWATVIRTAVSDGIDAARQALDPRQRDKAFGVRRLLGDYARIARFVGALTPTMNLPYRKLAQSLDEVAGILLVLMGEAIANIGFSGGRFLLQVALSELQERRDAVIYALRNLVGSTQEAYGPNDWPRGLYSYTQLLERLTTNGQSDLKTLFQENELARMMDDLIHLAAGGSAEGLRALGSTAQFALERFRRLIIAGQRVVDPESPPLTSFLSAIKLFLDAFENSASGYRLLTIARPPVLFYGLYGMSGPDEASERLLQLIIRRGKLAELLDCYLGCECGDKVRCQIILDKVLYDVDRAIDLYALGTDPDGWEEPEQRAAAYGFIIKMALDGNGDMPTCITDSLKKVLIDILDEALFHDKTFSIGDITVKFNGISQNFSGFQGKPIIELGQHVSRIYADIAGGRSAKQEYRDFEITIPVQLEELKAMLDFMQQELCIQKDAELQWESLLQTMAPSCFKISGSNGLLSATSDIIENAIKKYIVVDPSYCPKFKVDIPPHYETSLAGITYWRPSEGGRS